MSAIAAGRPAAIPSEESWLLGKEAELPKSPLFYQLCLDLFGELSDRSAPESPKRNRAPKVQPLPDSQARKRGLYRKGFNITIQKAALLVVEQLGIPNDDSLVPLIGKGEEHSNFEALVRTLNREVNRAMGKDGSSSERGDWTIQEFTKARKLIRQVQISLLETLQQELGRSSQLLLWVDT